MKKYDLVKLSDLLKESFKEDLEILHQDLEILTAPGEHYGSVMLKVDLKIKTKSDLKTLNLVAKLIPISDLLQTAFDVQVTFKKEAFSYTVLIPTLLEFQKEFHFPQEKILDCFLKCYGARYNLRGTDEVVDKNAVLLFENLKTQGYESIDRLVGCDLETANVVVKNLAKFHAVPLALRLLKPETFKEKVMPALVEHKGGEQIEPEVLKVFHNTIIEGAKQCEELKPYLDRIHNLLESHKANPLLGKPEPSEEYATMCHCDAWTSNMLVLRNPENGSIKVKLLDFQLLNVASPIKDLVFFLFTSVENSVLEKNINNLIELYYENFIETLKLFNINLAPYSWENFNKELEEVAPSEALHILIMLKVIASERGKVTNTIDEFDITDWTRPDLVGENHKRKLRDTVLALVARNWL